MKECKPESVSEREAEELYPTQYWEGTKIKRLFDATTDDLKDADHLLTTEFQAGPYGSGNATTPPSTHCETRHTSKAAPHHHARNKPKPSPNTCATPKTGTSSTRWNGEHTGRPHGNYWKSHGKPSATRHGNSGRRRKNEPCHMERVSGNPLG